MTRGWKHITCAEESRHTWGRLEAIHRALACTVRVRSMAGKANVCLQVLWIPSGYNTNQDLWEVQASPRVISILGLADERNYSLKATWNYHLPFVFRPFSYCYSTLFSASSFDLCIHMYMSTHQMLKRTTYLRMMPGNLFHLLFTLQSLLFSLHFCQLCRFMMLCMRSFPSQSG